MNMVNLRDMREAKGKAEELAKWARLAHSIEENIDSISKRVEDLTRKRSNAKDPRSQAGYDLGMSSIERSRAEYEKRKSEALSKMREAAHAILGKIGG